MHTTNVVLAAGQGTRMKSNLPKVLHPLGGKPLVLYSVERAEAVTDSLPVIVVGYGAEAVQATIGTRARFVVQEQQLGTGHAVLQARSLLQGQTDLVLVTYADMPLIRPETLADMVTSHVSGGNVLTILTVMAQDPRGFGRVVRDPSGRVLSVTEEAFCTPAQLAIRELNAGVYCVQAGWLWENLDRVPISPKGEYFLTDLVGMAVEQGQPVDALRCPDEIEFLGINTRVHLAEAEAALRERINRGWMERGVTLLDPAATYIEPGVVIGPDTTILPGTHLLGRTAIGSRCRIGPNSVLDSCQVADGCTIVLSVLEQVCLPGDSYVGPFDFRSSIGEPSDARRAATS